MCISEGAFNHRVRVIARYMNAESAALCEEGVCQILSCQKIVNTDLLVQGICVECRTASILHDLNANDLVPDRGVVIGSEGSEDEDDDAASDSDDEGDGAMQELPELVSDDDDDEVEDLSGDSNDSDRDDVDSARLVSTLFHTCFYTPSYVFHVCNILKYVLY